MITIRNIEELSQEIERQKDEYIKNGGDLKFFKPDFYSNGFYDMSNGHFPNVFLAWACLRKVTINNADLTCADLMGAKLQQANLSGAKLYGANLSGADLRWADLAGTDLTGADLRWAIFLRSQVGKSVIDNTIITKSQWDKLARIYNQDFMAGFIVKD